MHKIIPVILSGGSGKRLWPLSRKEYPKQYLPLVDNNTMLQNTILRLNGIKNVADPIIVCNSDHRFLVAQQCQQIHIKNPTILLEPIGRNTAPAIAAAALQTLKDSDDSILLVLSADHVIEDIDALHQTIMLASEQAQRGKIVTLGVVPVNANTGYGYIKYTKENNNSSYKVEEFVEKPDIKTAKLYLDQGNYLWNSGMFMFQASVLIDELKIYSPDIMTSVSNAVNNATKDLDFIRLEERAFVSSPTDSIDYAIMERSKNVIVVPLNAGWSDIGTWSALYDAKAKDSQGNIIKGDVIVQETSNSLFHSNHHMIVAIGVDNLIVIGTPDATFIAPQDKSHEVKSVVESLELMGRSEGSLNRKVYRPWGWFDSIESGNYFQVKKLHVNPGAKLSLQMHQKRQEHWVIVSGTATVTIDNKIFILNTGEATFIPIGIVHALENKATEPLEVIEVQSGSYLGEDDIVRFEDIYGRVNNTENC